MSTMSPASVMPPPTNYQWQNFAPNVQQNPFDHYYDSQITNQNISSGNERSVAATNNAAQHLTAGVNSGFQNTNQNIGLNSDRTVNAINETARHLTAGVNSGNQFTNQNIGQGVDRTVNAINETARQFTAGMTNGNEFTNQNINHRSDRIVSGLNDSTQYITANVNGVSKDVAAGNLGLRDAIERGNFVNGNAIERTSGDIKLNGTILDAANRQAANDTARDIMRAVDYNGSNGSATTERVGSNINSTVERTSSQIERLAGEGRLTTTVVDAASRQAQNDSARDIIRAVALTDSAVERTAGETRSNFLNAMNNLNSIVTDSRHSVLDQVNRGTNELVGIVTNNATDTRAGLTASILEQVRGTGALAQQSSSQYASLQLEQQKVGAVLANENARSYADLMLEQQKNTGILASVNAKHYSDIMLEQQKSTAVLTHEGDRQYASVMLEQQKTAALLAHEGANHYSSLLLEQQRVKEYLSSKGDSHFAMGQLEMHKVKEGLAYQAEKNFSSLQLEAAKSNGLVSAQLAEAKYDALKNTQFLADKMSECCCEVKMKIDNVDRDRLRDSLIVQRIEHHSDHRDNHNHREYHHHHDHHRRSESPRRGDGPR
jgi:hypothetical protein